MQPERDTYLPPIRRRPKGRDWGKLVARLFCVLFAVIGLLPVGLGVFIRSPFARNLALRETSRLLEAQGIVARYRLEVTLWPLSANVIDLRVNEKALPGGPKGETILKAARISVRPKLFALLSGKVAVDSVEVDAPRIRLVVRDGVIVNLPFEIPKSSKTSKGPLHVPLTEIAVTDADVDVDVDGTRAVAEDVDVDVTVEDDPVLGSSFEIGVDTGLSTLQRERPAFVAEGEEPRTAVDEDIVCGFEARVRLDPTAVTVRRLNVTGFVDLDEGRGTLPSCDLPHGDPRYVELSLAHGRVDLPEHQDELPKRIVGRIKARAPFGIASRFAYLGETEGVVSLELDARYGTDTVIPDLSGTIAARGLKISKFKFAHEFETELSIQKGVVRSPKTTVRIADGTAVLTDTIVEPLAKGVPIRTNLDVREADFTSLMRDLGVSEHSHVQWDLRHIRAPSFAGTLNPLKLDGDVAIESANFAVFDKARDDPTKARLIGFKEANVTTHVAVRTAALEFRSVHAVLPGSELQDGFCSIGFHNDLIVEVPKGHVTLSDIAPIGSVAMGGVVDFSVDVRGKFTDPKLEADLEIADYTLGETAFGDVTHAHATFSGTAVDLRDVTAKKGKSTYAVPSARLEFGGAAGMQVDAFATTTNLDLRDFFAIFRMQDDPRFSELGGEIATNATIHVALGGPEDTCGDGLIDVRAGAHLRAIQLYGETFDEGDVNLVYHWGDRLAGIEGADIDIRSLVMHKAMVQNGARTVGSVIGSATIKRGGDLSGGIVIESIPLGRLQTLGTFAKDVDGSVSGFARVSGKVSAFRVESQVDVTPIRVRGSAFGASHLNVAMVQAPSTAKAIGKTRCGGVITAPFDKEAYLRDTSSAGDYLISGEMFGGQIVADGLTVHRAKAPAVEGRLVLRHLDLAPLAAVGLAKTEGDRKRPDEEASRPSAKIGGEVSGEIDIEQLRADDLAHAYVRFVPTSLVLRRGGQRLALRDGHAVVKFSHDMVTVPDVVFDLTSQTGLSAAVHARASVIHVTGAAEIDAGVDLEPLDLALLVGVVPRIEQSSGTIDGTLRATGPFRTPDIDGEVHLRGGNFSIHGLPTDVTDVALDIQASASEIRVVHGEANVLGGTLEIRRAVVPLRGLALGTAEAEIAVRDARLTNVEGVAATADAVLGIEWNAQGEGSQALPKVSGDVTITSFEYARAVNLVSDLTALGARSLGVGAQRTVVESYDPSLDSVLFDVNVRSRTPLQIRNNLVEVQLRIDSDALVVTGTNQRYGLRGELKTVPGGRFHFRNSDFDIRQAVIRFDDPTRILPKVDVVATTEFRRYQDAGSSRASGAGTTSGTSYTGGYWRFTLHAYGDSENIRLDMTSEPPLSQEDIVLLLTIGMTRAEVDQVQAGSVGAGLALEAVASASGADRAVKSAVPLIDDFRFGTAYSSRAGQPVPQVSVGKRLSDNVRAQVTSGITSENRELRANVEWRLGQKSSVLGSYDNINSISASPVGNLGIDFRWRLEFE